jgi:hypothetical protein
MSSESRVHPLPKLNLAPDAPIDAIPGVGLVRARSLRKAGWLDVAALRTATAEQLAAVPGITAGKAEELAQYLRDNPPVEAVVADPPRSDTQRVTDAAATLLAPDSTAALRPRLAKQLQRWLDASDKLISAGAATSGKLTKQLARSVTRVEALVAGIGAGRKRQRRLAARLRIVRRKMRKAPKGKGE